MNGPRFVQITYVRKSLFLRYLSNASTWSSILQCLVKNRLSFLQYFELGHLGLSGHDATETGFHGKTGWPVHGPCPGLLMAKCS